MNTGISDVSDKQPPKGTPAAPDTSQQATPTARDGITQGASGTENTLYKTANQTHVHNDSKAFFRNIPNFDGTKDGCTTRAFIKCCKRARTFVPQISEENIVFSLMGKLKREYGAKVIEEDFKTIDDLTTFIRARFESPPVPYTVRIAQFNSMQQEQRERVSDYGEGVTSILREIIDEITQANRGGKEQEKKLVTQIAVDAFIKGLQPQYVKRLKTMKFDKLVHAIKEAVEAETLCEKFPNLGMGNNYTASCLNIQPQQKQNTQNTRNTQTLNRQNNHCNYCNRSGQERSECRVRKRENDQKYRNNQNTNIDNDQRWNNNRNNYNNRSNNSNTNNRNNMPSQNNNQNYRNTRNENNQYSGHIATECRKCIYDERQRQNNFPVTETNRSTEAQAGDEQGSPHNSAPMGNP
ncbi:hypothetical protein PV327_011340, partial [Microctonus hyperodae]